MSVRLIGEAVEVLQFLRAQELVKVLMRALNGQVVNLAIIQRRSSHLLWYCTKNLER